MDVCVCMYVCVCVCVCVRVCVNKGVPYRNGKTTVMYCIATTCTVHICGHVHVQCTCMKNHQNTLYMHMHMHMHMHMYLQYINNFNTLHVLVLCIVCPSDVKSTTLYILYTCTHYY